MQFKERVGGKSNEGINEFKQAHTLSSLPLPSIPFTSYLSAQLMQV